MKYLFALSAIALLLISSCKKEEMVPCPTPPIETIPNYMPLAIGNYWVYNNYKIDTLGNETKMNLVDSIFIKRDTILNNNTYFVIEGAYSPYPSIEYILRDSSGYLVNEKGQIEFSVINFLDTLYFEAMLNAPNDTFGLIFKTMDSLNYSLTVPAGNFDALDYLTTVVYPYNFTEQKTKYFHKYNAENVGTIIETWGYLAATDIIEKRLVSYQVVTETK